MSTQAMMIRRRLAMPMYPVHRVRRGGGFGDYERTNDDGTTDIVSDSGAVIQQNIYGEAGDQGGTPDPWYGSDVINTTTSAPRDTGSNSSNSGQPSVFGASLPGIIAAGLKTISNIFSPPATSIAQAQAGAQQQYYSALQLQQQNLVRNAQGQYVPAGTQALNAGVGVLDQIGSLFGVSGKTVLVAGLAGLVLYKMVPGGKR